jgi:hypothetical protein
MIPWWFHGDLMSFNVDLLEKCDVPVMGYSLW